MAGSKERASVLSVTPPSAGSATGSVVWLQSVGLGMPTGRAARRIWWLTRLARDMANSPQGDHRGQAASGLRGRRIVARPFGGGRCQCDSPCPAPGIDWVYARRMTDSKPTRTYDVVLYGASGSVGRQTVAYFARHPQ